MKLNKAQAEILIKALDERERYCNENYELCEKLNKEGGDYWMNQLIECIVLKCMIKNEYLW